MWYTHAFFYLKLLSLLAALWLVYKICRSVVTNISQSRLARQWHCKAPPRIPTWDPIMGIDILRKFFKGAKEHNSLDIMAKYFDELKANTASFPILTQRLIATREPENVKAVLAVNFEHYKVEPLRKIMVPFVGNSIFVVDGSAWQHSRNVIRPVFTRSQLADFSILSTHVDRFVDKIPKDGSTVDLQPLFFDLTVDVATHVMLGESIDTQIASNTPDFVKHYDAIMHFFATGGDVDFFGITWPSLAARQYKKDCRYVHEYVEGMIERAAERFEKSKVEADRYILVESLLSQKVPRKQIRAEILSTILAGRDTTASTLSDLWFELSQRPKIFAKLHTEISEKVDPNAELDYDTIKGLPYLKALLNENLRYHPVVPDNARMAKVNTTLPLGGGPDGMSPVLVPKGSLVTYSTYAMHRREDIWGPDAHEYKPERWLDHVDEQGNEVKGCRPGWAYLPFNGGPRVCIGQQFALLQASYVTIKLCQAIGADGLESRDPSGWVEKISLTATGLNGCKIAMRAKA